MTISDRPGETSNNKEAQLASGAQDGSAARDTALRAKEGARRPRFPTKEKLSRRWRPSVQGQASQTLETAP